MTYDIYLKKSVGGSYYYYAVSTAFDYVLQVKPPSFGDLKCVIYDTCIQNAIGANFEELTKEEFDKVYNKALDYLRSI